MPVMTTAVAVWRRLVVRDALSGDGYLLDLQDLSRHQSDRRPYTVPYVNVPSSLTCLSGDSWVTQKVVMNCQQNYGIGSARDRLDLGHYVFQLWGLK